MSPLKDVTTLPALLDSGDGDAPSILAPGRPPLSFDALRTLADRTGHALHELGIGRSDRLAIVLPNGPEMAACFVAVGCHATAAPLNPAYREEEFTFFLSDLGSTALIVEQGARCPAVTAAGKLGVRIIELAAGPALPAGEFTLVAEKHRRTKGAARDAPPRPDDIALTLHTSGTTSRPKLVPLSHRNLCASAASIADTLRLDARDRCLNVMPLFHIHGLMAALLATLSSGGVVFAAPGFDALRFFAWIEEARPTWYTAVPTMHQAILLRTRHNRRTVDGARLRFIRSASAPLPRQTAAALEAAFSIPVVEAYAMTEAAHQVTSNPLPPGKRIPGTVGRAAGPEVAIMDEASDTLLDAGETGEVVIRGANVMGGYENNPDANARAFAAGWFRTGDRAVMDGEGYLTLTGRLKEVINRGGEKISPLEIDRVLMDHPAVSQAVAFAVPHRSLGEDVAAAVVLRGGAECGQGELRRFAAARLAAFKVPRRIVLLEELPRGATGKVQRIGLAGKLGLA